ncbi:hypothetical protein EIN_169080 [Entamoeba invadens IP1]|uniref:Uncharacterized protein n=1 Tax=Entamoeba invadens IP1 TaxID=370355 RepID=A0A0A1U0T1_ENTIV|nr:hypothetical protein EIN_169080 [Entamoeba invadens IP1]ELP84493.1 hypothetical protein EIN_169080 [Entamoeba invadens IP1]|eukprot:XP_004183839.1 hypothetical protein EIN_169080 [Entamoeba invadens IP1]
MSLMQIVEPTQYKREVHRKTSEFQCLYSFKENRNYQSQQEGVFLYLLSQLFTFEVHTPNKRCMVTLPFLRLDTVTFSKEDVVWVSDFVQKRISERIKIEMENGISEKTALRRCENYKISETLHFLMDVLSMYGYFFQTRTTTGKKGMTKVDVCFRVFKNGKILYDQKQIEDIGEKVNQLIVEMKPETGKVVVDKNTFSSVVKQ